MLWFLKISSNFVCSTNIFWNNTWINVCCWHTKGQDSVNGFSSKYRNCTFFNVSHLAPKVFWQLQTMFFLKNVLHYFDIFTIQVKDLSPNRHAWHSPVTQFALPLKMKPSKQEEGPSQQEMFFTHQIQVQEISVFVHCTVCCVLIMAFMMKWWWICEWIQQSIFEA